MMNNYYPKLWQNSRALVILKIIFDIGRPVQRREIIELTGGDDETITYYLNILATMGLVTRVYGRSGFALTAQGFKFMQPEKPSLITEKPLLKTARTVLKDGILPLSTTTTTNNINQEVVVVSNSGNSVFENGNLEIFDEIGITLNDQTRYIASHVDPKTTRAEWEKLVEKGKAWPGLLIKILSSKPKQKSQEEREQEIRRKYAKWDQERR